jgi:hypothetical protein
MSETKIPNQRPALAKSADADLHPTTPKLEPIDDLTSKAGSATSDVMRAPKEEKLVTVKIDIPKSLRKSLRIEAEKRGISVPPLINAVLRDRARS